MLKKKALTSTIKNQKSKIKNQKSKIKNQKSKIKNQLQLFSSNSISAVELTNGNLIIKYENGQSTTPQEADISPELQKLKTEMEKNGDKKLTKEDLEKKLRKLEKNKQGGKEPKKSNLGLKIGIGIGAIAALGVAGVIISKLRKKKY